MKGTKKKKKKIEGNSIVSQNEEKLLVWTTDEQLFATRLVSLRQVLNADCIKKVKVLIYKNIYLNLS